MTKPSIPQGTRDFGPDVVRKRNYIFDTIKKIFELYGFEPLETPALENLETLMGKYGEESDKLIFKILNNGLDNPSKQEDAKKDFVKVLQGKNVKGITERALKYDLTIPFARYVAMNHGQLTFPYKRYQVQPVWRADRPQKGRYREFYQCDADIVGSYSLLNEVELVNIYHDVFTRLGLKDYELRINHRKILIALAELCEAPEKMTDITISIDKLEKSGIENIKKDLSQKGFNKKQIGIIEKYVFLTGTNAEMLAMIKELFAGIETAKKGIEDLEFILKTNQPPTSNLPAGRQASNLQLDPTLARGLNYYTGIIFEGKAPPDVKIGSIGGGGRYDDLTGLFGVPNVPGVGISFGVDRIYDVLEELNLFPEEVHVGTQVLFFNLGDEESKTAYRLMQQLRKENIRCEIYVETAKFDKQFRYAEKKNIPLAVIIGSKEIQDNTCTLKDLRSGKQESISFANIVEKVNELIS